MPLTPAMIVEALHALGVPATAPQVVEQIRLLHPDERLGKTPEASVRARLQENSSDSRQHHGRRDLFYRATPIETRKGLWGLREAQQFAPQQNGVEGNQTEAAIRDDVELFMAPEGRQRLRTHLARERSAELVRRFKRSLRQFDCSVCAFNFEAAYGGVGRDYIEAHHVLPVAEAGERMARVDDLVAVCSNCHRMLHRNGLLTWEALRAVRQARRPE